MNPLPRALPALAIVFFVYAGQAVAQTPNITGSEFATQTPGKTVPGTVPMCINAGNQAVPCSSGTPTPVVPPLPLVPVTGQVKIAVTGTAVPLPSAVLLNGLVVKAKSTNTAQTATVSGTVGPVGVTNVADGTGTGFLLAPGEASSFAVPNANALYVNGTAGDIFTFEGN